MEIYCCYAFPDPFIFTLKNLSSELPLKTREALQNSNSVVELERKEKKI